MKALLVSLMVMVAVISAQAQKVSLEDRVKKETDGLVAALDLGDDKAKGAYEINLKYAKERKAISKTYRTKKKAGEEVNVEEKKEAMKSINQKKNKEIKSLLGKELLPKYKAYKKQLAAERKKAKESKKGK